MLSARTRDRSGPSRSLAERRLGGRRQERAFRRRRSCRHLGIGDRGPDGVAQIDGKRLVRFHLGVAADGNGDRLRFAGVAGEVQACPTGPYNRRRCWRDRRHRRHHPSSLAAARRARRRGRAVGGGKIDAHRTAGGRVEGHREGELVVPSLPSASFTSLMESLAVTAWSSLVIVPSPCGSAIVTSRPAATTLTRLTRYVSSGSNFASPLTCTVIVLDSPAIAGKGQSARRGRVIAIRPTWPIRRLWNSRR